MVVRLNGLFAEEEGVCSGWFPLLERALWMILTVFVQTVKPNLMELGHHGTNTYFADSNIDFEAHNKVKTGSHSS